MDEYFWELEFPDFPNVFGPVEIAHSPLQKDNSLPLPGGHAVASPQVDIWQDKVYPLQNLPLHLLQASRLQLL